jgi:hypothetical protein
VVDGAGAGGGVGCAGDETLGLVVPVTEREIRVERRLEGAPTGAERQREGALG